MRFRKTGFSIFIFFILSTIIIFSRENITSSANQRVKANVNFLSEMSGGNKFIFNVNIEDKIDGIIKEFFIEDGQKILPVITYEISKNKYVIVVNYNNKDFSIDNVKLGVTIVKNRTEGLIKNIATLNGKNSSFKSGQVIDDPMLLYHDQDKINIAIEVDDPWDTLKNVQAIVVYPEIIKNFEVNFEKKYIVVGGKLKQFVYISFKGFKENQVLKFNINLLFQRSMKDVSLKAVNKTFFYNSDLNSVVKYLIKHVYVTLIERNPTSSELSKYFQPLISKVMSVSDFIIEIVNSNEFKNISISDGEFLNRIYKVVLNREADDDGKAFWIEEIKKTSRMSVLKKLIKNEEYVRVIKELGLNA